MIDVHATGRRTRWSLPQTAFQSLSASSSFIDELFGTRVAPGRSTSTRPLDVYIPAEQGDLLYSLVRYLRPHRTLEVGLANGFSTLHIAQALEDNQLGAHTAIDPFQSSDWDDVGLVSLQRAGLAKWVEHDPRPSHAALPAFEADDQKIQFAFVDGSHLFEYVMADFLGIDRILSVGGLIAFDDSDWPAVTSVIRFAITNRAYQVFETGIVIEPSPGRPNKMVNACRRWLRHQNFSRRIFRHDFLFPSRELGIEGRCVVLQKQTEDERDNQCRQLSDF